MNGKMVWPCTIAALVGVTVLSMPLFAPPPSGSSGSGGSMSGDGGNNGDGRLSPASLDLDTCGCPTTFRPPVCEEQTSWTLDKTTDTEKLDDPDGAPFSFTVTVTEGPTEQTLIAEGTIRISNSGGQTPTLANVAVLLEDLTPGQGDAPGPSGNNWTILAVTAENEHAACGNQAGTCYGVFDQSDGAKLILYTCGGDPNNENDVIALSGGIEIPPAVDDDNDGMTGEDPALEDLFKGQNCFGIIDNDGDGLLDEDPIDGIDNDNDGLVDEDGPDDDGDCPGDTNGDGIICGPGDEGVDEDNDCDDIVEICFVAEFDISGLGIEGPGDGIVPSADDLRIDLLVTFKGGGKRGGTCKLDVDCDGVLEDGKFGNPDEGEGHVRTVQQRLRFDPVECDPTCECVQLTDAGASANDPSCVGVISSTLDEEICATGVEGTETVRTITGTVSCINGECGTDVSNTATLECEDNSLIEGSPASASFEVNCGRPPDGEDFCTQTQGGWGQDSCSPAGTLCPRDLSEGVGGNVACFRNCIFDTLFPDGLIVGDPDDDPSDGVDGDGSFAILLTSSAAVAAYLPAGGMPAALTADQTDPAVTSSGVFGGQLVAATLNVAVDDAGLRRDGATPPSPAGTLGTLLYVAGCVDPDLVGLSVNQVIALSNIAISGGGTPAGVTISDLNEALSVLNENFVDCDTNNGCLAFP